MTIPFRGGCACGRIRYECRAVPIFAANCYCRDCQHASGSAFASLLVVPAEALTITGSPRFHETTADSGDPMRRGFCADCGSPLLIEEPHRPRIRLLQAASLDEPSAHRPTMSLFTSRAHPWAPLAEGVPTFPAMPPIPESFGR
jgi:hypothetical protein